jgi:hypothetical protein
MSHFSAEDLNKAFKDGVALERKRVLDLFRNKIITDPDNGDQQNEYRWYEKFLNGKTK